MMEFLMTMAIIALAFVTATIVVALLAGGLVKLKGAVSNRNMESVNPN